MKTRLTDSMKKTIRTWLLVAVMVGTAVLLWQGVVRESLVGTAVTLIFVLLAMSPEMMGVFDDPDSEDWYE